MNNLEILNEDMSVVATKKLRDAIHDIIVGLNQKETMDVEELSNALLRDNKITISPFFLDKFLDDFIKVKSGDKKASTFFTLKDTRWLGIRNNKGIKEIRNNLLYLKPILSKYKRKLYSDEESQKLEQSYKLGMLDLNFNEDILKKTLILQRPEDSKEMMKLIYSDVIINKKYYNTYENCWKLMCLLGKKNNLDRIRGYFKFAPQSVKDEFKKTGKVNMNLKMVEKQKTTSVDKKESITTTNNNEDNTSYLEKKIKYNNWIDFTNNVDLLNLINLIDGLKVTSKHSDMEVFLSKVDALTIILKKYYMVEKPVIINYFKKIGLARFIREWESTKSRPKINDF